MDGKITFAGAQARHRFLDRAADIVCGEIAEQEKACGVGMTCQIFVVVFACQDLKRGVFHSVVAPRCQNVREFQYVHGFIIV